MKIVGIIFIFLSFSLKASIFGEENVALYELVATTASQLNELEKLVTNAERYTKRMREYNELMEDHYFRAERIGYLAEELTSEKKIEDLGGLNYAIRELKYSMADLKELMNEYSKIKENEPYTIKKAKVKQVLLKRKKKLAKRQVISSEKAKNTGRSTQLTAQNTALILENQIEANDTRLDQLKEASTTNRLLAEDMENRRLHEIKMKKMYQSERSR